MIRTQLLGAALLAVMSVPALAQTSENRVAANTDWSVFVETNPSQCWAVSAPKETVNTRDGRVVAVQRGDILMFVSYSETQKGVVSFTGGYPFAPGSTVDVQIGSDSFQLFTEGDWAWAASEQDDSALVAAMKRGSDAVLSARSSRGTTTRDTFSLLGFTAAVDDAAARCN